ncbi:MAG: hypothetical protein ACK5L3_14650 [Oscillospiraceae bacterium]
MEKTRSCYFDNAKFLLILLVVAGHGMELLGGRFIDAAYKLVYLFHMPAFVVILGYFSKTQSAAKMPAFRYIPLMQSWCLPLPCCWAGLKFSPCFSP